MVVEYRIGERREVGHVGRGIEESFIEANVCFWIDVRNRVVGIISSLEFWLIVARSSLAENFSGAFQGVA